MNLRESEECQGPSRRIFALLEGLKGHSRGAPRCVPEGFRGVSKDIKGFQEHYSVPGSFESVP